MPKYKSVKPALVLLLATATVGNAADLRAGIVKYDGGPALYAMVNGQHFICDDCPSAPKLVVAEHKPQPYSFSVKATLPPSKAPSSLSNPLPNPVPVSVTTPIQPAVQSVRKPVATAHFLFDSEVLSGRGKAALKQTLAGSKLPVMVKVEGHTCLIGSEKYNHGLSFRRAKVVKAYLESLGVKVVGITGLGSSQPLGGKLAADRRAEIWIVEKDEPKKIEKTDKKEENQKEGE